MAGQKKYILVAGVDPDFKLKFREYCENRKEMIIKSNSSREELHIYLFDFKTGKVELTEVSYSNEKVVHKVTEETLGTVLTKQMFIPRDRDGGMYFKPGQKGFMSITHVYSKWDEIGKTDPGTLQEVHFFSHGWEYGPVLINSDDAWENRAVRDPHDGDPRMKDFKVDEIHSGSLQKAMHKDGFFWCWGCSFPDEVHKLLSKLEKCRDYKEKGLKDEVVIKMKELTREEILAFKNTPFEFPDFRKPWIEFRKLKSILRAKIESTYYYQLAVKSRRTVYAALPGTYAGPDNKKNELMIVTPSLSKHLTFYTNYMGFDLDPEGRGYGKHEPVLL